MTSKIIQYREWANGTTLRDFQKLSTLQRIATQKQGSQNGEDGIIKEVLKRLNITSGWVCEFGAINGIELSNTFQLVKKGFKAVMIEPVKQKFEGLLKTAKKYPNIIAFNKAIEYIKEFPNQLADILKETEIPKDFDLLSIDIDSFDYQVWENFEGYSPKIVIIEANPYMTGEHIFGDEDSEDIGKVFGAARTSIPAILKLGKSKGYTYFGLVGGNTFWIRNDLSAALGDLIPSKEEVKKEIKDLYGKNKAFLKSKGVILE